MTSPKKVFCVILNWNGKKDTLVCLESLQKINTSNTTVSVVVVDNASTDDSVEAIRSSYPKVHVIESSQNEGYTGGNNTGMEYAMAHGADFVWLLNNDTYVHKKTLSALLEACTDHHGILGSKIYFAPGREFHPKRYTEKDKGNVLWYAGGLLDWDNVYPSHRGVDEVDNHQYDNPILTDFVTGCSMFIPSSVIKSIGYFDYRYYLYLEDVEYCLRANKAGFGLWFIPSSQFWHVNATSSGGPGSNVHVYYQTRNRYVLGMSYASGKTKLALIREAFKIVFSGDSIRKQAVLDAVFGRLGKRDI